MPQFQQAATGSLYADMLSDEMEEDYFLDLEVINSQQFFFFKW